MEDRRAGRRAGGGREPLGDDVELRLRVDHGVKQLVDLLRLEAHERLLLREQLLLHHVHGDLDGGGRGPLPVPRLEHVQDVALDGEFEILHVLVMLLELRGDPHQLVEDLGEFLLHVADLVRRADAGHDILALRVDEILAVKLFRARRGVPREADAGGAIVPHVSEHHRLDVHRRADIVGNSVRLPVILRPVVVPRPEHRVPRQFQLDQRVLRELPLQALLDQRLELPAQVLQILGGQVDVVGGAALLLLRVEDVLEVPLGEIEHDVGEHHQEAAIGIVREPRVAGVPRKPFHRLVVQSEVEDRVHHPRHGELRPRPDGDKQRVFRIAEFLPERPLELREVRRDLRLDILGKLPAVPVIQVAGVGADGKPRRNRHAEVRHLGESRSLPAEDVLHRPVPLGLTAPEKENPFHRHSSLLRSPLFRLP
jgi:hypothetical protein